MSQDIQISSNNSFPMQGDFMPPSGGNMPSPGSSSSGNPLAKFHRILRGRYPIVIILAVIFGAVGGALGYFSQRPQYTATGTIEISPLVRSLANVEYVQPMFLAWMRVQQEVLRSPRVMQSALNSPEWKATGKPQGSDGMVYFASALTIDSPKGSNMIMVNFTDPDAAVASTAVRALISSFIDVQKEMETADIAKKVELAERKRGELERGLLTAQNELSALGMKYGTIDLTTLQSTKLNGLMTLETQRSQANIQLEQMVSGKTPTTKPTSPLTVDQVRKVNPNVNYLANEEFRLQMEIDRLARRGMGDNHPEIVRLKGDLQSTQDQLKQQMELAARNPQFQIVDQNGVAGVIDADTLRNSIARLDQQIENEKKQITAIQQTFMEITTKQNEITQTRGSLDSIRRELTSYDDRLQMMGRVNVLNWGDGAAPASDKRPMIAAAGAFGGMAVPVGLMLLIGLMDSRLRYSDETDTDMSGITLLGILPNLPDRLSDPEQAATAAHCVHQIRTMLQINGAAMEQSVFAVTSASPGDGKTSLNLALGLSFAACGNRTLLIDCDLIGAGLTRRLGIQAETGILEAAAQRTVLEHIRTTDITDVAILPVGSSGAMHASTLSPNALRRIIQESKKHFDTILIDTGPILGSIEASLVATVADGIILTVARGQHRQVVEKSLRHLMSIGAKIAGVVFNRAESRDFERALSNVSMRSLGIHAAGDTNNRYGPLGHAVQGQYTK